MTLDKNLETYTENKRLKIMVEKEKEKYLELELQYSSFKSKYQNDMDDSVKIRLKEI